MRKGFVLAATLLLLVAHAAPALAQQVKVRKALLTEFPEVTLTVSVGGEGAVDPNQLTIKEEGIVKEPTSVRSLVESGGRIEVVLVIDTSGSMLGAPLQSAVAAATDFVKTLPPQVRVGLVAFSDAPRVVRRLTVAHNFVLSAIPSLEAVGETAMYDGVSAAAGLFTPGAQHNIVLLSDGGDTASSRTLADAQKLADANRVTIFAVGLRSGEFDEAALRSLASKTDGRYSPAGTADLSAVYEGLATELGNQFVVSYDSAAEPGESFNVNVDLAGAGDSLLLLAPASAEVPPPPVRPEPEQASDPLLEGPLGMAIVLALVFASTLLIGLVYLGSRSRKQRERRLARRIEVPFEGEVERPSQGGAGWIPDPLIKMADSVARDSDLGAKVDARLEKAGWPLKAKEFIAITIMSGIGGLMVGSLLIQKPLFILIVGAGFASLPRMVLSRAMRKRLERLQSQLADTLMILASSLRAGHSFLQALDAVAKEMRDPGGAEFARVVGEIRLGRPVEEALNGLAERIDSDDFRWAMLAVNVQRDVGGNLAEVLDTVATTIRERDQIRRQVKVLAAEGKMSIHVLTALPFVVATYMALVRPEYIGLLFSTQVGLVMTIVASALLILGIFWMRKVVKIDV